MTRGERSGDLEGRTKRAMIGHAVFRIESALTVALVIVLAFFYPEPFHWWKWWYWLLLGLMGEVFIIYTSLTDLPTGQRVVAEMLRQEFDPRAIHIAKYRQRLEKALEYRERIQAAIKDREEGVLQDHLHDTLQGVSDWIGNIYRLSKRLDSYEDDALIHRDMKNVPKSLAAYRARLKLEDNPAVRQQIEEAIERQEAHKRNLGELEDVMEKAEFQL